MVHPACLLRRPRYRMTTITCSSSIWPRPRPSQICGTIRGSKSIASISFAGVGIALQGRLKCLKSGHPIYDWGRAWLLKHHGPEYPTNHVVLIKLQSAKPLMWPQGGGGEIDLSSN